MGKEEYPYVPGKYGFDLTSEVKLLGQSGKARRRIQSESGRNLDIVVMDDIIAIEDARTMDGYFKLSCQRRWLADKAVLSFNLRTQSKQKKSPHPDLYGGEFLDWAIDYYHAKSPVSGILGCWYPWSINYSQYINNIAELGVVGAAMSTWTGQKAMEHKFNDFTENDLRFLKLERGDRCIIALFSGVDLLNSSEKAGFLDLTEYEVREPPLDMFTTI